MTLTPEWIAALAGLAVLGVTAYQSILANRQWKAMVNGLSQQRELFDLVERPIVVVDHAEFEGGLDGGKPLRALVTITNNGRTGAKDIVLKLDPHFLLELEGYPKYSRNMRLHIPFLASNESVDLLVGPEDAIYLLLPDFISIREGKMTFVISGVGIYLIMDRKQQYSVNEFAFQFEPSRDFVPNYKLPVEWHQRRVKSKVSRPPEELENVGLEEAA